MAAAWGPAFTPSAPPVTQPAATLLYLYRSYKRDIITDIKNTHISFLALNPSIQHSDPAYIAPTSPKPFALDHDRDPMSLNPRLNCSFSGKSANAAAPFAPGMPDMGVS